MKNDPKTTHRLEHKDVWCGVYNREESRPITASKEALGGDDPRAGNSPGEMLILGPSERAGVHPSPHGELGVRRPHARTAQARAARGGAGRWGRRGGLPLPAPSAWTVLIVGETNIISTADYLEPHLYTEVFMSEMIWCLGFVLKLTADVFVHYLCN